MAFHLDVEQFQAKQASCSRANRDWDDLGLGERRFALITAIEFVEHLDVRKAIDHASRHLAANGTFLMMQPQISFPSARLRFLVTGKLQQFDEHGDPTHINPIYHPCLERILARHRLCATKYIDISTCLRGFEFQKGVRWSLHDLPEHSFPTPGRVTYCVCG